MEDNSDNIDVKGDVERKLVQFYTWLSEKEVREFLAQLGETNEDMKKGYEIVSITPPSAQPDSANKSPEEKTGDGSGS